MGTSEREPLLCTFVDLISALIGIDNAPAQAQNHSGKQRGGFLRSRTQLVRQEVTL